MKYIRTKGDKIKTFPNSVSHSSKVSKESLKSAGYYKIENGEVKTYDKSHSFNVYPLKTDKKLIEKHLNNK